MEKIRTQIKSATRINVDPFQNTQQKSQVPKVSHSVESERERKEWRVYFLFLCVLLSSSVARYFLDGQNGFTEYFVSSQRKLDESQQQEQDRVNESSIAAPPAALRGNLAAQSTSTSAAQRELELQLKKIDATKSITERFPSGADVVVECLRQRKFNSDVKDSFKKSFWRLVISLLPDFMYFSNLASPNVTREILYFLCTSRPPQQAFMHPSPLKLHFQFHPSSHGCRV